MQALRTMSYCSTQKCLTGLQVFVLQSYEQYYTVSASQVKKSDAISSEYFYQIGFQHNIVTTTRLVKKSTLRPQSANRPLFHLTN